MINRTRWFKRSWFLAAAIIVFGGVIAFAISDAVRFVVCSAAQVSIYGMPQPQDAHEAEVIRSVVTTVHHFSRNSVSQTDRPPVFSNPGSALLLTQPMVIEVYEVPDRSEQDKIIGAIRTVVRDRKFMPVDLRFFDHENWPAQGEMRGRGPELQLRRVRISQSGTREDGGKKTITYPW